MTNDAAESRNNNDDHSMNLQIVNDAFGAHADLYMNCLHVSPNATSREIQNAFLAQRRKLFQQLEQGQDCHQEMDAIVLAVRILGDAELRAQYDKTRKGRIKRSPEQHNSFIMESRYTRSYDNDVDSDSLHDHATQDSKVNTTCNSIIHNGSFHNANMESPAFRRVRKRRARIVTPEPILSSVDDDALETTIYSYDDSLTVDQTLDPTIDDMTVFSGESHFVVPPRKRNILDRIADECIGAFEDTSKSLEEVFSVFTLQEEEIDAVVKRIHKAQRQMNLMV